MSKFISLFTDFGFKRVFGQEENKKFLIGFLNSLFEGEFVVTDLHYCDKEQPPEIKEGRGVIYDIHCTLADGRHLIIEMQNETSVNFAGRALYYVARRIIVQGKRGHWYYTFAPVFPHYSS
ncbi:MAG: Rpn family recombination-promoting nuclease/putative transposase [Proteobacteria bacterium]|nr:Rpn family recombination-promoting nuclease/putative transposase [Pseudomonadota bacterium]